MATKPNLYALVVGINKYPSPVRSLNGCRSDAESMVKYLNDHEKDNYNIVLETLYDEAATHANVVQMFQKHLAKATSKDVAFFFFAGHGAQEDADPAWREPNKKLEGLVCFDSVNTTSMPRKYKLLADKELRYLLQYVASKTEAGAKKAKSPHIVVVTDCCHSGENTRGGTESKAEVRLFRDERGGDTLPMRAWGDFIFAKNIPIDALKTAQTVNDLLPQTTHVALAACQANELATEDLFKDVGKSRGVFTKNLIDILERTQGAVTYYDLRSRIKNYVKNKYTQIPQIYAAGDKSNIFKNFLGGSGGSKPTYANVQFTAKGEWVMDMGAIHGISGDAKTVNVVSDNGKENYEAIIKAVRQDDTVLTFEKEPPKGKEYKGTIKNFFSAPIQVFIDNLDKNTVAEAALKAQIEGTKGNISLATNENLAEYAVRIFKGYYVITDRIETDKTAKYRPLIMPVKIDNDPDAGTTYNYLFHISQWAFVKNLENTASDMRVHLNADAVDLQVVLFKNGKETPLEIKENPNNKGEELLELTLKDDTQIKIRVVNKSTRKLYVNLLYLSNLFEVNTGFLGNSGQILETNGATVQVYEGDAIDLTLEEHIKAFNFPASDNYLKLIVSTEEFSVDAMERDALPDPALLLQEKRSEGTRGAIMRDKRGEADAVAWTTRTILFRNPNPDFGKKPENYEKLKNTEGGMFIEKLY